MHKLTTLALAAATCASALAQSVPEAESPKEKVKLDAVVVTATKRLQSLQKTPLAVSVLGGTAMEELNLNNMSTITAQLPTVNYRANASNKDSALFIRGVGTISTSPGVEPTVSMVVDGVVTARPGQATMDLVEVERIEVLRGPQGTLFGKNSSAGAINIVTRAPGVGAGGYVDLSAYQGGEHRIRLGGHGGSKELKGSISVMKAKYDGNVTNVFDGSTVNGYDRQGVRGRVDFAATPDLKLSFIADHTTAKDTTPTGVPYGTDVITYPTGVVTPNPLYAVAVAPVVPSPSNRQINANTFTHVKDTNQGASLQVDYSLPRMVLTSITAHRGWKNQQFQDQDRQPGAYRQFPSLVDEGKLDFSQFTQELRVASSGKQSLDYVAGVFYFKGKNDETYRRDSIGCAATVALPSGLIPCVAGAPTTLSGNGVANYGIRSTSKAAFGEGTYHFSETLRTIAGLRYTQDDLSYYHGRVVSAANLPGVRPARPNVTGATQAKAWSGRVGPQFDLTPDVMAYATYSRGYKGPAYNVFFGMLPTDDIALAPEKSKSYELGLKSELLDRRLRLNIAAFQTDYDGYQANMPDLANGVVVTRLINAGRVSTKGIELDLTARVTSALTVNASIANIMARIDNFNCPPGAPASCDINGKPLPYAPDWKASLRVKYIQELNDTLSLDYGVDASWQSRTNFDITQQPNAFQPQYAIYNARIALQSAKGWQVALIGRNLGDKSYATLVQSSGTNINRYVPRDDKRYFGINVRYDF